MNKTNVESLSEKATSVKRELRDASEEVVEQAEETGAEVLSRAGRFAGEASRAARDARENISLAYDRTSESAQRALYGARRYARHNPGLTAAVTFASGIGIGLMLAPRRRSSALKASARQGLVPIAAVALAHAVLQIFDEGR